MLEKMLKKCFDEDDTALQSSDGINGIKTAVLSRIEEEKPMKHFSIKPLLIAAAITVTAAASVVTANAATDGAIVDGVVKTFKFFVNGMEVEATVTEYSDEDGKTESVSFDLPGEAVDNNTAIVVLENDDGSMQILNGGEVVFDSPGEADVDY